MSASCSSLPYAKCLVECRFEKTLKLRPSMRSSVAVECLRKTWLVILDHAIECCSRVTDGVQVEDTRPRGRIKLLLGYSTMSSSMLLDSGLLLPICSPTAPNHLKITQECNIWMSELAFVVVVMVVVMVMGVIGADQDQSKGVVDRGAGGAEALQVQPRATVLRKLSSYFKMMEQMQRIGTKFFLGGAKPVEADEWRIWSERNFRLIRCPEGYQVDLAVHYLQGDPHLWWRGVAARRAQAGMIWADFVGEFNAKYFPTDAIDRLEGQFLELSQGIRMVCEYEAEFNRLSVYVGRAMEGEQARVLRFLRGLRAESKKSYLARLFVSVMKLVETATFLEEGLRDEAVVVSPTLQAKKPQHQFSSSKCSKPLYCVLDRVRLDVGSREQSRARRVSIFRFATASLSIETKRVSVDTTGVLVTIDTRKVSVDPSMLMEGSPH
ncbi:Retrotransposon gag domain [Arabidopsis suecica]|uniref:Retrotransposon gag domain n=1 Tax=Arabidopsis suecica TaxID=45249 RepID=A0A8T1ZU64_ARASU|nr:Retrotransposon gag domain [Arabidopsis suecica]